MDATRKVGCCYPKMEYDFLEHATVVMSSHFAPLVQFVAPQEREHCQQLAAVPALDYNCSLERKILCCAPPPSCPDIDFDGEMEAALAKLRKAREEVERIRMQRDLENVT